MELAETPAIAQWLRSAARRGVAVLLTSHILSLVDRVSDRIVLMKGGRVLWNSPLDEMQHDTIEQMYFQLVEAPALKDLPWLGLRE